MTKQLLFVLFCLLGTSLLAQTVLTVHIHHKLGENAFEMNTATTNNQGVAFDFFRLEYYVSGVSIIHDGGQETIIEDSYTLVQTEETATIDLGEQMISTVEAIRFHIGVDEEANHSDPALYHTSHALSPKMPSMHWGWTSGYRFAALEGYSGDDFSQLWNIHALVDQNYFQTEIPVSVSATNNQIAIHLDADYNRILENIDLSGGLIVHGGYGEGKIALENFRDYVFSPSDLSTSSVDFSEINQFSVYPNPATAGDARFIIDATEQYTYQLTITDLAGRLVKKIANIESNELVDPAIQNPGVYFLNLHKDGERILTKKLVIQ